MPDSDRMGARLEGANLTRTESGDLLSEAVAPGTVQVPPDGNPILLLSDCQTIGGYSENRARDHRGFANCRSALAG